MAIPVSADRDHQGTSRLLNLPDPLAAEEAARKSYVDTGDVASKELIVQSAHGFSVGMPIRDAGGTWIQAQADTVEHVEACGMVESVPGVDSFVVVYGGRISGLSGLTAGVGYFVSETAGAITATEPTISKPILWATSATSGIVLSYRSVVADRPGADSAVTEVITQAGHGFTVVGTPVRSSAGDYVEATADTATNAEALGLVSEVIDVDTFVLTYGGRMGGLSGLTPDTGYYVGVSGGLTATEPAYPNVSKPILWATAAGEGIVVTMRGTINTDEAPPVLQHIVQIYDPSAAQSLDSTTYVDLDGSSVTLTPKSDTSTLVYTFSFQASSLGDTYPWLGHLKLMLDGVIVPHSETVYYFGRADGHHKSVFQCSFASWGMSSKTLKIQVRNYDTLRNVKFHETYYWEGAATSKLTIATLQVVEVP